jgi:GAF domain-containing protein
MALTLREVGAMDIGWPEDDGAAFRAALDELTALLVAEESLEVVLRRVVELACAGIGACSLASVTVVRSGREPETIAYTDPVAAQIDEAQYEHDSGPCLYALRRREVVSVPSMAADDRWTPFRERAMSQGVQSSFSLPLAAGGEQIGALNLYSREDHGFNSIPPDTALLFAAQAAAALWNARTSDRTRNLIRNLEAALETRDAIGMAKGIIMGNEKVGPDEAFQILVTASQHRNIKVSVIATEVIATGATPKS